MLARALRSTRPALKALYSFLAREPVPNLAGDRDVEYSWIAAQMPTGPGQALDFGAGNGYMGLLAAQKGFVVTAVDLTAVAWPYEHQRLCFTRGDLMEMSVAESTYDLIINCSVMEHIGLPGRYGLSQRDQCGDLDTMAVLRRLIKPGRPMILTIPVGIDVVHYPHHRVYGEERLSVLVRGWDTLASQYWAKPVSNIWRQVSREEAMTQTNTSHSYALGLFTLAARK